MIRRPRSMPRSRAAKSASKNDDNLPTCVPDALRRIARELALGLSSPRNAISVNDGVRRCAGRVTIRRSRSTPRSLAADAASKNDDACSTMALHPPAQPMVCTQLRLKCRDKVVRCATQWGMAGTHGAWDRQLCMHAVPTARAVVRQVVSGPTRRACRQ